MGERWNAWLRTRVDIDPAAKEAVRAQGCLGGWGWAGWRAGAVISDEGHYACMLQSTAARSSCARCSWYGQYRVVYRM